MFYLQNRSEYAGSKLRMIGLLSQKNAFRDLFSKQYLCFSIKELMSLKIV
jgi:hypothetical protein